MKSGLCSITFRKLSVPQVVELARSVGLQSMEWGGDVHVPPGDITAAETARKLTLEAGMTLSSYGSYYAILDAEGREQDFGPVLETALALGTDTIRVWAGALPSQVMTAKDRGRLVEKFRKDLDRAAGQKVRLATEFHINTLCDSNSAALRFFNELSHPNLFTYWQPMYWVADEDYRLDGLRQMAGRVLNLHVFHWIFRPHGGWADGVEHLPLAEGEAEWSRYLSVELAPGPHFALLEFVRNHDPEQLSRDADALHRWLAPPGTG
jgi:3-dehydroshikimate dehydratase